MFKDIVAVLFDIDGTLLDSMSVWADIDYEFFENNNLEVDYEVVKKAIEGCTMYETADYFIENFNMKESSEELVEIWNNMAYEHYKNNVMPKPGAVEFVNKLHDAGITIGVASSNSRVLIEAGLAAHGLLDKVEAIVTASDVEHGKPAPDVYLKAADALKVDIKKCMVFEDVIAGLMAGKSAGAKTCVIYDDYSKNDWDDKVKFSDYHICDYNEVIGYIYE